MPEPLSPPYVHRILFPLGDRDGALGARRRNPKQQEEMAMWESYWRCTVWPAGVSVDDLLLQPQNLALATGYPVGRVGAGLGEPFLFSLCGITETIRADLVIRDPGSIGGDWEGN
jgi:hypothetical protein